MASHKSTFNTFIGLSQFLGGKDRKILAHNTIVFKDGESVKVQYHDSVIACLDRESVILSNDGYFTSTTKERLNWFLGEYGYRMFQSSGVWTIYNYRSHEDVGIFPGQCTYIPSEDKFTGLDVTGKERKDAIKRIKAFCKDYMTALISGDIAKPDSGECWYCYMTFPDSFDHIDNHIEESYYVPSLIVKAIQYQDKTSPIAKQTIGMLWDKHPDIPQTFLDVLKEQGYKTLYNYCLHCYDLNR